MVNFKNEIEAYTPINIDALEELNGEISDSYKDSIAHYNKALELFKFNSEDIAILELKRALNLNPHFTEAQNLLGLFYAYTGDEDKAVENFKAVIAAENNSVKALDYLSKISGTAEASNLVFTNPEVKKTENVKPKAENKAKKKNTVTVNKNNSFLENYVLSFKYHIIGYILLFILGAALFSKSPSETKLVQSNNDSEAIASLNSKVNELTENNKALTDENNKLKEQINGTKTAEAKEAEKAKTADKLNEAETLAAAKNYEQAADLLMLLKDVEFTGADKDRYNKLSGEILPRAAWNLYLEGTNSFNSQDYKNASIKLAKSISYGGTWDYTAESYYNLGRSYQSLGDKQNALNAFNTLKTRFPNTEFARNADLRIAELNG